MPPGSPGKAVRTTVVSQETGLERLPVYNGPAIGLRHLAGLEVGHVLADAVSSPAMVLREVPMSQLVKPSAASRSFVSSWALGVYALASLSLAACADPAQRKDGVAGRHFAAPQGVATSARWILVTNTAFSIDAAGEQRFGPGFVSVVDRATRRVVSTIPTTQRNPQRVVVLGGRAYVLNSGIVDLGQDGPATVTEGGGIDVIALDGAKPPRRVERNIPLGTSAADARIGAYGSLAVAPDGRTALIGSGTRGDVFAVDLQAGVVLRGPDDPIALFSTPSDLNDLTTVRWVGDQVAVLSFARDQLCLSRAVSPADPKALLAKRRCFDIGRDPNLVEGPIDVVQGGDGKLLVAMTLANRIYRVAADGATIEDRFAPDLLAPNRLQLRGAKAYALASTSEQLMQLTLPGGAAEPRFATFPSASNPFSFAISEPTASDPQALAWVTLWRSHQLAIVDLATGDIVEILSPGAAGADGGGVEAGSRDAGPTEAGADAGQVDADGSADGSADAGCGDAGAGVVGVVSVEAVSYGPGAGLGQGDLPQALQGGPQGAGSGAGATTGLLSLGEGGEIVLAFGDHEIVDGPGPDFIVFENPFLTAPYQSYAEPAIVGLSATDTAAASFVDFSCDLSVTKGDAQNQSWAYPGCAGVKPVLANPTNCIDPTDPTLAGGDAFDLADLGLSRARYVRIRDAGLSTMGTTSRGFDLDAVVLIHHALRQQP